MNTSWRIMAIDDDAEYLKIISEVFDAPAELEPNTFEVVSYKSFDEGLTALDKQRFDLMILDVNEEGSDPSPSDSPGEDQAGERLFSALKSKRFVPVIFFTGHPYKVENFLSPVVKIVTKGDAENGLRQATKELLDTGIPGIVREIENQSRDYMWTAMAGKWKEIDKEISRDELVFLFARRIASILRRETVKEYLGLTHDLINPLEMYIYPPQPSSCLPGDIVKEKESGNLYMVLNPACDFANNSVDNVLLASLLNIEDFEFYSDWVSAKSDLDEYKATEGDKVVKGKVTELEGNIKNKKGNVVNILKDKFGQRYRILPGTFFISTMAVDFQSLKIVDYEADKDKFDIICSLDSPFREEYLQHFTYYFGRIGTPDIDKDNFIENTVANLEKALDA